MKLFALDTHIFLNYLVRGSNSFSPIVNKFFKMSEQNECIFYIPTICFWEINYKITYGRFKIKNLTYNEAIKLAHSTVENTSIFRDLPLSRKAASMAPYFRSKLPDPFDQLIVASALEANLPLITKDANIQMSKLVRTVW